MAKRSGKLSSGDGWAFHDENTNVFNSIKLKSSPKEDHKLKFHLEKRKNGKIVTLIENFELTSSDLKTLTQTLKNHCGAGGKHHKDMIEIQGNHRDTLHSWFKDQGWGLHSK